MAALARVERTDFLSPLCIGEVVHASAEITYTSKHSVEVQVNVTSENILTGKPCADRGLAVRGAGPNTARDGLLSLPPPPARCGRERGAGRLSSELRPCAQSRASAWPRAPALRAQLLPASPAASSCQAERQRVGAAGGHRHPLAPLRPLPIRLALPDGGAAPPRPLPLPPSPFPLPPPKNQAQAEAHCANL